MDFSQFARTTNSSYAHVPDCVCINFAKQEEAAADNGGDEWGILALNRSLFGHHANISCAMVFIAGHLDEIVELRFTEISLRDKWVVICDISATVAAIKCRFAAVIYGRQIYY